jgi:hypothetical protein
VDELCWAFLPIAERILKYLHADLKNAIQLTQQALKVGFSQWRLRQATK